MGKGKPLAELSPAYRARIESAIRRGIITESSPRSIAAGKRLVSGLTLTDSRTIAKDPTSPQSAELLKIWNVEDTKYREELFKSYHIFQQSSIKGKEDNSRKNGKRQRERDRYYSMLNAYEDGVEYYEWESESGLGA